ncbi:MAG TPA: hypothetical protein VM925_33240 [Labilithrix sp.]|nr:hypothetical protein [Labilithrix sp.]
MRLQHLLLGLVAVVSVACGSSANDPPASASPTPSNGTAEGERTPSSDDDSESPSTAAAASGSSIRFVLHNSSAHDVYLLRDGQWVPLWLEIDGGLQLSGYGKSFCGSPDPTDPTSHNDPYFALQPIAAGASYEWAGTWEAVSVSLADTCWNVHPISAGKHSARVCVHDDATTPLERTDEAIPTGGTSTIAPASKWFSPEPSRCIDVELDVPVSGTASIEIEL